MASMVSCRFPVFSVLLLSWGEADGEEGGVDAATGVTAAAIAIVAFS